MSVELVIPALVAIVGGVVAGLVRWPLRPAVAMSVLTGIAISVAATVSLVVAAAVIGLAARSALVLSLIEWCPVVPLHHQVGLVEGFLAIALTAVACIRIRRVLRRRRWAIEGTAGEHLSVLDTNEPIAYAAPGDPGCVVVSRGLLDSLTPRQRQVVLAHERAHLHHKHHRFLLAAELALAIVAPLGPLVEQIRLATERAADDDAVEAMGGDRQLVAQTIARAALTGHAYSNAVGAFGGASIPARIDALVGPPRAGGLRVMAALGSVATALTVVASGSIQAHHLVDLVGHICNL